MGNELNNIRCVVLLITVDFSTLFLPTISVPLWNPFHGAMYFAEVNRCAFGCISSFFSLLCTETYHELMSPNAVISSLPFFECFYLKAIRLNKYGCCELPISMYHFNMDSYPFNHVYMHYLQLYFFSALSHQHGFSLKHLIVVCVCVCVRHNCHS